MKITAQAAVEYVKAHFTKFDEPQDVLICGVGPSVDTADEPDEFKAIDVFFLLTNEGGNDVPYRFTVWVERYPNVAPVIYGEW